MEVVIVPRNHEGEAEARRKLGRDGGNAMDGQTFSWEAKAKAGEQYLGAVERMHESDKATLLAKAALRTPRDNSICVSAAERSALTLLGGSLEGSAEHTLLIGAKNAAAAVTQPYQGQATRGFLETMAELAPESVYGQAAIATLEVNRPAAQGSAVTAMSAALAGCPSLPTTQLLARIALNAMDGVSATWEDKAAAARPFLGLIAEHEEDWARSQVAAAALKANSEPARQSLTYRGALQVLSGECNGTADQALADAAERARQGATPIAQNDVIRPFLEFIPRS